MKVDKSLLRILQELTAYKWRLAFAAVCLCGAASASSLTAVLLGKLTDAGFYGEDDLVILAAPLALILVSLLFAAASVLSASVMASVSQDILVKFRAAMFDRLMHLPLERLESTPPGQFTSKFVNEATVALSGAAEAFIVLVRDSVQVAALVAVLFTYNAELALVTLAAAPALVIALRAVSRRIRRAVTLSQTLVGGMIERVQEAYAADRVVKLMNTYAHEELRFDGINRDMRSVALRTVRFQNLATPVTQLLTMVAVAGVVAFTLHEAQNNALTLGEFMTFLSAMLLIKAPLQHLAGLSGTFASVSAAADSIYSLLDSPTETDDGTDLLEGTEGGIVFENVSLRRAEDGRNTLQGVTLAVKQGEHLAIVGPSGAGKSTLVKLLLRFADPTEGRVLIGGRDIRTISLAALRKHIAYVPQNPMLFDDTLRHNLTYGLTGITEEQIGEALRMTALSGLVEGLPNGLETPVGEGGKLLSGGERQRVAAAHALLKNASVVVLDEATSALDAESEATLMRSFQTALRGRTVLTVTHRIKTVETADRIAVLNDGQLTELGTEEELTKAGGVFASLKALQNHKEEER